MKTRVGGGGGVCVFVLPRGLGCEPAGSRVRGGTWRSSFLNEPFAAAGGPGLAWGRGGG